MYIKSADRDRVRWEMLTDFIRDDVFKIKAVFLQRAQAKI